MNNIIEFIFERIGGKSCLTLKPIGDIDENSLTKISGQLTELNQPKSEIHRIDLTFVTLGNKSFIEQIIKIIAIHCSQNDNLIINDPKNILELSCTT